MRASFREPGAVFPSVVLARNIACMITERAIRGILIGWGSIRVKIAGIDKSTAGADRGAIASSAALSGDRGFAAHPALMRILMIYRHR